LAGIRHLAAFFEFDEFVSDLVDAGCDVRARDLAGYFPIDLARSEDTKKIGEILLPITFEPEKCRQEALIYAAQIKTRVSGDLD